MAVSSPVLEIDERPDAAPGLARGTPEISAAPALPAGMPGHVARDLLHGATALGLGMLVERGCGFLANLLAARLGGASTFGAYALALSTANNISSYAAGGIGSTAVRFSGRYRRDSRGYTTLSGVLAIISLSSALLAAVALWAGAGAIARLLGKPSLAGLLHWAALSAAGIILLECCRGFLVGQRRVPAILLLSLAVGVGMLASLPLASRFGPVPMIASQGLVVLAAVLLCALLYQPLGLGALPSGPDQARENEKLGPMLREVWSFGLVQLAGLVGMNAAGWWLTTLVARADTSLVQMGFLAVSHQLRNMAALAPSLLSESSLAVMARGEKEERKTPDQVMAVCTLVNTLGALLVAGLGILIVPWALTLLYGRAYAGAAAATAFALATAVVHMASSPASARLSIVSIRMTGVINTVWAVLVAAAASCFFFVGGNAWRGALIYLAAHLLSAVLVLRHLSRAGCMPRGMRTVFALGTAPALTLSAMAFWRAQNPAFTLPLTLAMLLLLAASLCALTALGRRAGWLPSPEILSGIIRSRLSFGVREQAASAVAGGSDV